MTEREAAWDAVHEALLAGWTVGWDGLAAFQKGSRVRDRRRGRVRVGGAAYPTLIAMSRRSTPERIYQAHRAGTPQRLIGEGELPDRAEALVASSEAETADDGLERDGRWWATAWEWIAAHRR